MKLIIVMTFSISFFLLSCENEKYQNRRLTKKLESLYHKIEFVKKDIDKAKKEQEKNWYNSVKERFANLYDIKKYSGKNLPLERYVRSVTITKMGNWKYSIRVTIQPVFKTIKPHFIIYLYNRKGLIVASHYQKRKLFGGKVKKGHTDNRTYKVRLLSPVKPKYFRIAYND